MPKRRVECRKRVDCPVTRVAVPEGTVAGLDWREGVPEDGGPAGG